jgi:hypothetical protein
MKTHQYYECDKKKNGGNYENNFANFDVIIHGYQKKYNSQQS